MAPPTHPDLAKPLREARDKRRAAYNEASKLFFADARVAHEEARLAYLAEVKRIKEEWLCAIH